MSDYLWIGHCFDVLYIDDFGLSDIEPYPLPPSAPRTGSKAFHAFALDDSNIGQYTQKIPINVTTESTDQNTVSSASDYELRLSLSISASVTAPAYSGSLSGTVRSMNKSSLATRAVNTLTTGRRESYQIDLLHEESPSSSEVPPLDANYKSELWLAATGSIENFNTFVGKYGTHFAHQVTMGGVGRQTFTLSSREFAELSELGIDVSAQASAVIRVVEVGGSVESATNIAESFKEAISGQSTEIKFVGGSPGGLDFKAWIDTVDEKPVPIKLDLLSHDSVCTTAYFPSEDPNTVAAGKATLAGRIENYVTSNGMNLSDSVINDGDLVCLACVPTVANANDTTKVPNMLVQSDSAASPQTSEGNAGVTPAQFMASPSTYEEYLWTVQATDNTKSGQPIILQDVIKLINKKTAGALDSEGAKANSGLVSAKAGIAPLGTAPNTSDVWSVNGRLGFVADQDRPINSGDTITLYRLYSNTNPKDPEGQLQIRNGDAFSNGQRYGRAGVIESAMAFQIFKLDMNG